jgi:hypothetical protein
MMAKIAALVMAVTFYALPASASNWQPIAYDDSGHPFAFADMDSIRRLSANKASMRLIINYMPEKPSGFFAPMTFTIDCEKHTVTDGMGVSAYQRGSFIWEFGRKVCVATARQ